MRKPVVAPRLPPLEGVPGVLLADGPEEFVAALEEARTAELPEREIERFIEASSWRARVDRLLELAWPRPDGG